MVRTLVCFYFLFVFDFVSIFALLVHLLSKILSLAIIFGSQLTHKFKVICLLCFQGADREWNAVHGLTRVAVEPTINFNFQAPCQISLLL